MSTEVRNVKYRNNILRNTIKSIDILFRKIYINLIKILGIENERLAMEALNS